MESSSSNLQKKIGSFKHYDHCRFCGSQKIELVIDLGFQPLAGGFITTTKKDKQLKQEKFYPLQVAFCHNCYLVQVPDVIDKDVLFKKYFYESSAIGTLIKRFSKVAKKIKKLTKKDTPFIVEIGANDGAFIKEVQKLDIHIIGIDPAKNIVSKVRKMGIPIEYGYFTQKSAQKILRKFGQADAIYSFNTLAHIEDMHEVIKAIQLLLKPDGYLSFEIHYLGSIMDELQYDMIYHEHQYYYSALALQNFFKQFDMEIFDLEKTETHAGSLNISVQFKKTGVHRISENVKKIITEEIKKKYHLVSTYKKLGKQIESRKRALINLLTRLKKEGAVIAGYGASGRGTIISNYCQLDDRLLSYIIDDAPAKLGVFTPGVHLPVVSSAILKTTKKPDYILLFAWSFAKEILTRNPAFAATGGKYILPLPKVQILQ